jgi:hypothetical protein
VESFHGRLRDECLNAHWFRTLNDVRVTLAGWRLEYNCERPHSSLGYRTPDEFRRATAGYANVESKQRFPHSHSLGGDENISKPNLNRVFSAELRNSKTVSFPHSCAVEVGVNGRSFCCGGVRESGDD